MSSEPLPHPPVAARRPQDRTHHGHTFSDPYEWMRDLDSPEVRAHLEAENAFTAGRTEHLESLRTRIYSEIISRVRLTDLSVPVRRGDWWHLSRSVEGSDYRVHARVPAQPGDWTPPEAAPGAELPGEQVLLDCNAEARGHEFFSLGALSFSRDGRYLVWAADTTGDELFELRIRDLDTGADLAESIPKVFAGAEIDARGDWVYYTTADEAWRPFRLWRHRVGTDPAADQLLLEEPDESFWLGFDLSRSGALLLIAAQSKNTSEWWTMDLRAEDGGEAPVPVTVWPRTEGVEYAVEHWVRPQAGRPALTPAAPGAGAPEPVPEAYADRLLITHNRDRRDFSVIDVPLADPRTALSDPASGKTSASGARPLALQVGDGPDAAGARIDGVDAFAGFAAVSYRSGGFARVGIARWDGETWGEVRALAAGDSSSPSRAVQPDAAQTDSAQIGTTALSANPAWDQPHVRVTFESFIEPDSVVDVDAVTGTARVRRRREVLGGVDLSAYRQRLEWAETADGTRVPVSIVWKPSAVEAAARAETAEAAGEPRSDRPDSAHVPAAAVLYGYGSYEASMDPYFSVPRLSLLDRGVIWAVAHVRGGGEMGRGWYEQGRLEHKQNTFSDFAAAAAHLIGTGLTAPERLAAMGGSAGGLLMGAVANQSPELFAGILADVPFVDPLTSILMPELPLTVVEWDEWGDPLHDAEAYHRIRAYSPYENVRQQPYPRILAVTSLHDTRVLCVEPAKWVARLREVGADVLLKTEMSAGHGGVSGRYGAWRDTAFEFAWLLDVVRPAAVTVSAAEAETG